MDNSPAFQYYPKDWLALTQGFSIESFGIIWKTISFIWLSETQGMIENDDEIIAFSLSVDLEKWQEVKRLAIKKNIFKENKDGFLFCPQLFTILDKQNKNRAIRTENGKKGGRPKTKRNLMVFENNLEDKEGIPLAFEKEPKESTSSSSSSSSSTSSSIEDPPLPPDGGDEKKFSAFDEFYGNYPIKTTKKEALAFWTKNKLDSKLLEILEGLNRYKVSDLWTKEKGAYVCDPIRFLTKERWRDDPEPARLNAVKRPIGTMLGGNEITPAHLRPNGPIKL